MKMIEEELSYKEQVSIHAVVDTNDLANLVMSKEYYEVSHSPDWCIGTCEKTKLA